MAELDPPRSASELRDAGFDPHGVGQILLFMQKQQDEGLHPGASLAVFRDGRFAFAASTGLARRTPPTPVTAATPFALLSATKAWASVAIHLLVERGLITYETRIAEVWPGFAREGKEAITLHHVLSHRGGFPLPPAMPGPDGPTPAEVVEQTPLAWPPGEANGYHFATYGWTIAELVQRLDGRTIQQFVLDEVFDAVGMPESFLGVRPDGSFPEDVAYVYEMEEGTPGAQFRPPDDPEQPVPEWEFVFNRPVVQRVGNPSGGGVGTARDMARLYGELAVGRLLRPETVARLGARTNKPGEVDRFMGIPVPWGLGFHLGGPDGPSFGRRTSTERCFGHMGGACAVAWADPDRGLGFAYLTNGNLKWGDRAFDRFGDVGDLVRDACI